MHTKLRTAPHFIISVNRVGAPCKIPDAQQNYLVDVEYISDEPSTRRSNGSITIAWTALTKILDGLHSSPGSAEEQQRTGDSMRDLLVAVEWNLYEQYIAEALCRERSVHITIASNAPEIHALPWELMTLAPGRTHLGAIEQVVVGREWRMNVAGHNIDNDRKSLQPTRVIMAWSAAGGRVPHDTHVQMLVQACRSDRIEFQRERDVIGDASIRKLRDALQLSNPDETIALHILCHGLEHTDSHMLAWDDGHGQQTPVSAAQLRDIIAPFANQLSIVTLSVCQGAAPLPPGRRLGSPALELHKLGIPWVVGARSPLTFGSSVRFTEGFYNRLLQSGTGFEAAYACGRAALLAEASRDDWSNLQLFARARHRGLGTVAMSRQVRQARKEYLEAILSAESDRPCLAAIITAVNASDASIPLDEVYLPPLIQPMTQWESRGELTDDDMPLPEHGIPFFSWLDTAPLEHKLVIVIGEMGSGKTEMMYRTRARLAQGALQDPRKPLPLLLRARDLESGRVDTEALQQAAGRLLVRQEVNIRSLLNDRTQQWMYLIDGLDEAGATVWEVIRQLVNSPDNYVQLVIGTSRPAVPRGTGRTLVALPRWQPDQVDGFLDRWSHFDAQSVALLRDSSHYQNARGDLVSNPLTATLALAIARQRGSLPLGRPQLFAELVDMLSQEWARQRGDAQRPWGDVAPALERVALAHVRNRRPYVSLDELRTELRQTDRYGALELENSATRCYGLLVRLDDGQGYEFLFRGLAEHLAGAALLRQGTKAVVEASYEPWAEEVVRHALGVAQLQIGSTGHNQLLLQLLKHGEPRDKLVDTWLRPLLISIRSAADVASLGSRLTETFVRVMVDCLFEEWSCWVGDRMADAVRVLAAAGGPLAQMLWEDVLNRLRQRRIPPGFWYAKQKEQSVDWLTALWHRDNHVRALAIDRLAPAIDNPTVREHLLIMMSDENVMPWPSPAARAGLAVRQAKRDRHFEGWRAYILRLLKSGGQFSAGAASLALWPNEAPADQLAVAFKNLCQGTTTLLDAPVNELANTHEGREALDKNWPQWQEKLVTHWPLWIVPKPILSSNDLGNYPPATEHVRRRLYRAFAPGFHHLAPDQVIEARSQGMNGDSSELCRALYYRPETIIPVLEMDNLPFLHIPQQAQRDLGRAALRWPAVKQALYQAWDNNPKQRMVISVYPGEALLPLVFNGDEEAIRRYAAWLPASTYASFMQPVQEPDPRIFKIPMIRQAAMDISRKAWLHASVGYNKEGKHMYLASSTMCSIMHHFQPAWIDEKEITRCLTSWLEHDETEKRIAACWSLAGGPLPLSLNSQLERAVLGELDRYITNGSDVFRIEELLHIVERHNMLSAFQLLDRLARMRLRTSTLAAAIILPTLQTDQTRALSEQLAGRAVLPARDILKDHHLSRLIAAAPEAWRIATVAELEFAGIGCIRLAMRILPHLPAPDQRLVVRAIHQSSEGLELPWIRTTGFPGPLIYARPSDLAARVLYDAGIVRSPQQPHPEQ